MTARQKKIKLIRLGNSDYLLANCIYSIILYFSAFYEELEAIIVSVFATASKHAGRKISTRAKIIKKIF